MDLLLEMKLLEDVTPKNLKFGIIMPTYRRKDGTTFQKIKEAIESVKAQTHTNWKIYLIGDDYEDEDEFRKITSLVSSKKIYSYNFDLPGERLRFTGNDLWHSGSNAAANHALDRMKEDDIQWVTRLDHDDIWTNRHLDLFSRAITKFPDVKFLSTISLIKRYRTGSDSYKRPNYDEMKAIKPDNTRTLKDCWHSALCWHLPSFDLRYRNVREQMLTEPVRDEPRGGDRDMIERITMECNDKGYPKMVIPEITVLYRNKKGELPKL